jgi:predicted acyl esterase
MRKITMLGAVAAALAFAPAAHAAEPITTVFDGATTGALQCSDPGGENAGERWCGTGSGTAPGQTNTVASFDGAPIDVAVALPPAPATGPDGAFPVVGVYHGYGGSKVRQSDPAVQRWVDQGYAVFSMTDRGFWGSCGVLVGTTKPPACAKGYIHLMDNAWEVHDAQYLLGLLADDGAIDPQRIGATGGSYGGGLAAQLGALKNRVQNPDGTLVPWTSPAKHLPMQIAATAPEFGWSDLVQALMPNGSGLDYAAKNPYTGPAGDRRFGVQKYIWNLQLYGGGQRAGYYAAPNADPTANISVWLNTNVGGDVTGARGGGPYDGEPYVDQQLEQFPRHGAYGTDDSVAPAPALLSNGWNDDLFPVDEALRYYNKIRADHPDAPISLFGLDFGHQNRAGTPAAVDRGRLSAAEHAWFAHYVRGDGPEPEDAVGGVTAITSACPAGTAGTVLRAKNWASLAQGEVRIAGPGAQVIAPDTQPTTIFSPASATSTDPPPTVCTTGEDTDTPGAAIYETAPATGDGYTIAGAPTILADLTVRYVNDAVLGRLYDVDPDGQQRLIARGTYRPTGAARDAGPSRQVWQLHPQAWKVEPGHTVKLELLGRDQPYALAQTGQTAVEVANLELRLPTIDAPGAAGGTVVAPAPKVFPRGYTPAADLPKPAAETPAAPAPIATTPAPAATVPAPAATPKDPLAPAAALAVLRRPAGKASLTRTLRTLRFGDRLPEAGTATYTLTIRVKGKDRIIGTSRRRVTKSNAIVVTIRPTAAGRRLLKAHPRTTLRLRTSFVTAVERRTLVSVRTLRRR